LSKVKSKLEMIIEELKKLKRTIEKNQNFALLFSENNKNDAAPAAVAFFYILKQMGKNAKIINPLPAEFNFLLTEKIKRLADFLIVIKEQTAKIIDVFYEKNHLGVNLFLKTSQGIIKPENIEIKNLTPAEPAVYLTFGISHFADLLPYFKSPPETIVNIDTPGLNENYGHLNLTNEEAPTLSELTLDIISFFDETLFSKEVSTALLSGLMSAISCRDSFPLAAQTRLKTEYLAPLTGQTLQKIGFLIEQGAKIQEIAENLCLTESADEKSLLIFEKILSRLNFSERKNAGWVLLEESVFQEIGATIKNIPFALKKLSSGVFPFENFFLLWEQHNSPAKIQGVFYSPEPEKLKEVARAFNGNKKGQGLLFQVQKSSLQSVKNKILEIIEIS